MRYHKRVSWLLACLVIMIAQLCSASDWPSWRGPHRNGVSDETGLISSWTLDGKNQIWRADFIGRSTPIVMDGRVYVVGRTGSGMNMQRVVACYSAKDGKLIWEEKSNVTHTTVPFNRIGWSSLTGDPETGNVYLFSVDGMFVCYSKDGERLWDHSFTEEYNRFSGYGGRTSTPVVDEDLVIVDGANNSWGDQLIMKHRYWAYDKKTGELVWVSTIPEGNHNTNYSVPVVAVINGQRMLITGTGTGFVYAMQVRTGEQIWKFELTKGAVQSSVVVDGNYVYASHSSENIDNVTYGRVVCIDGTGTGDVTKTNEVWRYDAIDVGYTSPIVHAGRLYVITDSGNMLALDAKTGKHYWTYNVGKVGKGSPVWADGKIFATEVNGSFHIIDPGENEAKPLDAKQIPFSDARFAEIYGSPAIAYKRIYFASEVGVFCLGDPAVKFKVTPSSPVKLGEEAPTNGATPSHIQIVPAEVWIHSGKEVQYKVRTFDDKGHRLGAGKAEFSLAGGLTGEITPDGKFKPAASAGNQAGYVVAKIGELESKARVEVAADLPWTFDFENFTVDKNPPLWPGTWKFFVRDMEGNKVLEKPPSARNLGRHNLYLGPPDMTNYVIQADLMAEKIKRRSPDMGLVANAYYFDFMTKKERLQIRTWPAELNRLMVEQPFSFNPDIWYTMKLQVDIQGDKALVKGKIWPRDESEPAEWTITVEDPHANMHGSPALYGDAATSIFFDNVKITRSK